MQYNTASPGQGSQARGTERCDTDPRPTIRQPRPATRPWSRPQHGAGLATTRPRACGLGAQAKLWLCTWCTWPVFDSVLLLSHFLGTIHEHCSSQKNFEFFFNKIKSNKIKSNGSKLWKKNEIFENKIFEDKIDLTYELIVSHCI